MERKPYPSDVNDDEWAFAAPYLTLMTEDAPQPAARRLPSCARRVLQEGLAISCRVPFCRYVALITFSTEADVSLPTLRESFLKVVFLGWAVLILYLNFPSKYMQLPFYIVLILVLGTGMSTIKWDPERRRWSMTLPLRWQAIFILITALAALGATLLDWAQGTGPLFRHFLWVPFALLFYWKSILWIRESLFLRDTGGTR